MPFSRAGVARAAPCAALLLLVAACGGEPTEPPTPPPPGGGTITWDARADHAVVSIVQNDSRLADVFDGRSLGPGDSIQLAATVYDVRNIALPDAPVRWFSTDTTLVRVSPTGMAHVVAGPRRLEVEVGVQASAVVVSTLVLELDSHVATVASNVAGAGIVPGGAFRFAVMLRDTTGRVLGPRRVTYTSSDPAVATVAVGDSITEAVVTGTGSGSATITAAREGVETRLTVTVARPRFDSLAVGPAHACGLTADGAGWCWGGGQRYQISSLGSGIPSFDHGVAPTPVRIAGDHRFLALDAGLLHTCARATDGAAYCWGDNTYGQLGDGTTSAATVPGNAVAGGLAFVQVVPSERFACGLTAAGAAYCWGTGAFGKLGSTTAPAQQSTPGAVEGGHVFRSLAVSHGSGTSEGAEHACGVTTTNEAWCWGFNGSGQLGNGTTTWSATPVLVAGGHAFAQVALNEMSTCGVTTDARLFCWGAGQPGDGFTYGLTPIEIGAGRAWARVSVGPDHSCALTTSGAAYCWGQNTGGQLGTGTASYSPTTAPAAVTGGLTFRTLGVGGGFSCGLAADGTTYCWGGGFIGTGTFGDHPSPTRIAGQP